MALGEEYVVWSATAEGGCCAWSLSTLTVLAIHKEVEAGKRACASAAAVSAFGSGLHCPRLVASTRDKSSLTLVDLLADNATMRCAAPEPMGAVAASPDGALVAAGGLSGRLYVWDAASGDLLRSWTGHYKAVSALAFSPCGSVLASGGGDGIVHCWDVAQAIDVAALSDLSAMPRPHPSWTEHSLAITSLAWGPAAGGCGGLASKLVSSSADRSVRIWDVAVGRCLLALSFPSPVNRALVDPWEAVVYAACEDGGVYTAALHASALAQRGATGSGAASGAGAAAAGLMSGRGGSGSAGLLASAAAPSGAAAAGAAAASAVAFVGHAGPVHDIALTADGGRLLSAGQDGLVRVWDTASRQQVGAFDTARAVAAAGGAGGASSGTAGGSGAAAAAATGSAGGAGAAVVALLLARYDRVAAPGAGLGALAGRGGASATAGGSAAPGARSSRQPAAAAAGSSSLLPSGRGGGGAGGVGAPDNVYAAAAGAGVGCGSIAPLRKFARPLPPDAHGSSTGAGDVDLLLRLRPCVRDSHPSSSSGLGGGEASSAAAAGSAGAAGGDGLLASTHRFRGATDPLAAAALGLQSLSGLLSAASAVHASGAASASTPSGVCAADDFSAPPAAAAAATFAASAAFRNAASEASAAAEVTALRERVAALEAEGQRWRAVNNKLLERLGAAQQGQGQGPAAAAPVSAAAGPAPSPAGVGSKRSR